MDKNRIIAICVIGVVGIYMVYSISVQFINEKIYNTTKEYEQTIILE